MREWADQFQIEGAPNMFSVCNDDYSDALEAIATAIQRQIRPACFARCARDMDVRDKGLQVDCVVTETVAGSDVGQEIVPCQRDGEGAYKWEDEGYVLPDAVDVCYAVISDRGGDSQTDDAHDDMDAACVERGTNLEFKLQRRRGALPAKPGTRVTATCQLSEARDVDCPGMA